MPISAVNFLNVTNPTLGAFAARSVNRNNNLYAQKQGTDDIPQYQSPVVKNDILANRLDIMA
ncbi:hypothetical protein IJI31_05740 [bacterium]|nr:hypothetical protein [bacterium]